MTITEQSRMLGTQIGMAARQAGMIARQAATRESGPSSFPGGCVFGDSIPVGSAPVDSIPVGSVPVDSVPVDNPEVENVFGTVFRRTGEAFAKARQKSEAQKLGKEIHELLDNYTTESEWEKFLDLENKVTDSNVLDVLKGYKNSAKGLFGGKDYEFFAELLTERTPEGIDKKHIALKMLDKVVANIENTNLENARDNTKLNQLKNGINSMISTLERSGEIENPRDLGVKLDRLIAEILVITRT